MPKINPAEAALLLIDMQNDVLHEKGAASSLGVWKFAREAKTIESTKRAIEFARKNKIPVIYVKLVFRPDYADASSGSFGKVLRETKALKSGTWGAEIVDELKPEPTDYIVEKKRASSFYSTDLEILLKGLKRNALIACGVVTNFCVETTVRDAIDRDFKVIVLKDCIASVSKEAQEFPVKFVFPFLGVVTTSQELSV